MIMYYFWDTIILHVSFTSMSLSFLVEPSGCLKRKTWGEIFKIVCFYAF